ncbi:putative alpha/beta hydrolase [Pontibacter ummariensis]|uniref:Predicted alpha/beta hydrolase n=1 Tax=Pontibacter ummariensis TaxID=1610492 RepID=A0A239JTH5_9BACT|nr:alpha/beta fold hydrolase [Pontibacter ummariensis]PRY07384.1 putative alpha/beta hydrolase [Pontibacter ummariensis]SNT08154.1 Predicted alpha/beta hydrolase [Pontibacter ummariensis]
MAASATAPLLKESLYVPVTATDTLHVKRFSVQQQGPPALLLHGSIENGRIFYSKSGKGFAPYLASQGFDVFVPDLRGRGKSIPRISGSSSFGLTHSLEEDIPAIISKIKELKGDVPQYWGAHSWGGVLLLAYLARPVVAVKVPSLVFFASKRRISIWSPKKFFMIDVMWYWVSKAVIGAKGYLPAKQLKMGSDSETFLTHEQTNEWVVKRQWRHWKDGFDYAQALQQMQLPPTLYLCGAKDEVLGHPTDVEKLLLETGAKNSQLQVLSKANGNLHDYGHVDILTHPDAAQDHFPVAVAWLKKFTFLQPTNGNPGHEDDSGPSRN